MLLADEASSSLSEPLDKKVPDDVDVAVEAHDASCLVKSKTQDPAAAKGQSQDSSKGQCDFLFFEEMRMVGWRKNNDFQLLGWLFKSPKFMFVVSFIA